VHGCPGGSACWARRLVIMAVGAAVALSAVSCSAGAGKGVAGTPRPPAQVTITPARGTQQVLPGARVSVTAARGTLRNVVVRTAGGRVAGQLGGSGTTWRSAGNLDPVAQLHRDGDPG
jgi:hypothetical protein